MLDACDMLLRDPCAGNAAAIRAGCCGISTALRAAQQPATSPVYTDTLSSDFDSLANNTALAGRLHTLCLELQTAANDFLDSSAFMATYHFGEARQKHANPSPCMDARPTHTQTWGSKI